MGRTCIFLLRNPCSVHHLHTSHEANPISCHSDLDGCFDHGESLPPRFWYLKATSFIALGLRIPVAFNEASFIIASPFSARPA